MMNHPMLDEKEYKVKDNLDKINKAYNNMERASESVIRNSLSNTVNSLKEKKAKIPSMYKGLRDNLTLSANKLKKDTEEHIANTGNHTAGGYAMSKRMNNDSAYLKELNAINSKQADEISSVDAEIRKANADAAAKISENKYKLRQDKLSEQLKEAERTDNLNYKILKDERDYNFDREKFNEEKRVNDSKIKINEGKHNLEMMYEPSVYEAKIKGMEKDNELTDAKIKKTLSDANKTPASKGGKTTSGTKLTAAAIAKSIRAQASTKDVDYRGREITNYDPAKALTFLLEWKKKYNLSDQLVNDASVILEIQGYF